MKKICNNKKCSKSEIVIEAHLKKHRAKIVEVN